MAPEQFHARFSLEGKGGLVTTGSRGLGLAIGDAMASALITSGKRRSCKASCPSRLGDRGFVRKTDYFVEPKTATLSAA